MELPEIDADVIGQASMLLGTEAGRELAASLADSSSNVLRPHPYK